MAKFETIPFDVLANFRDLGDYTNRDGRKIKSKRLVRSGELFEISDADVEKLEKEFQVKHIVDFRRPSENEEKPNRTVPGSTYHNFDLFASNGDKAPSHHNLSLHKPGQSADEHMIEVYEALIFSPNAQRKYKEFLNLLLNNEEGSVLWHCFAGKDRTGVTAMFILTLLDADKDTIFTDFLRTNELRKATNDRLMEVERQNGATEERLAEMNIFLNVNQMYLERAYEIIEEHFDSVDNYLFEVVGFNPEDKERFQNNYLER